MERWRNGIRPYTKKLCVDLPEILPKYDILITCTASTLPIIGLGMVQSALKRRKHRPIFMIDLAVPRDIEREVDDLDEVYVYTVDDLGKVVQSGIQGRKAAVEQADRLIETKVDEFISGLPIMARAMATRWH